MTLNYLTFLGNPPWKTKEIQRRGIKKNREEKKTTVKKWKTIDKSVENILSSTA